MPARGDDTDVLDMPSRSRKPDALVVEDEMLIRMLAVDQLQDLGFEVETAASATEGHAPRASSTATWTPPSSIAACRIARARRADRRAADAVCRLDAGVIASGYGDLQDHTSLRNDAHIRFMSKPYDIDALTAALRALRVRTREMS